MINNPSASNARQYSLSFLSAFLLFAATPGRWSFPIVIWIALVPLFLACHNTPWRRAATMVFCSALAYYISIIYWIIIALHNFGGLSMWIAWPAMALLAAYLALYMTTFAALLVLLQNWPLVYRAPVIWVALDYIKTYLFTGFPWQDLGYSQFQHPILIQFADLIGHNGLTFLIIMTNALLTSLVLSKQRGSFYKCKRREIIIPLAILTGAILYSLGSYWHWQEIASKSPNINIALAQGNIDQAKKWTPGQEEKTINIYQRLSQRHESTQTDIIVWPETALPFFPLHSPLFNKVLSHLKINGPVLITGAPHYEGPTGIGKRQIHNSAFALSATTNGTQIQRYDKEHLVPFGEYVPFSNLFGGLPIVQSMGNFSAGTSQKPIDCKKARCGILICFESIFPDIARRWSAMGANLLINLTNDAWYGRTSAPWQQLSMVTLRAVENRRSLVRAANTGISVFIDPLGRLHHISPIFEEYTSQQRMPLLHQKSFYTEYGYLFAPTCLFFVILMGLRRNQ